MSPLRLVHILSLLSLSILGPVGLTGCAGTTSQDVIRTLAPARPDSFSAIVARTAALGCKVGLQDQQLPLLIIDCPEGRVAFGPDSGRPRVSGIEDRKIFQSTAQPFLQADCLHGLQSRCQEYVERLLGLPLTPPEQRTPKGPNPLVRPPGRGWYCFTINFGTLRLPSCHRSDAECSHQQQVQAERGTQSAPCQAIERASCYTTGRGHGDWECAATPTQCEQARDKGASACGLWE